MSEFLISRYHFIENLILYKIGMLSINKSYVFNLIFAIIEFLDSIILIQNYKKTTRYMSFVSFSNDRLILYLQIKKKVDD